MIKFDVNRIVELLKEFIPKEKESIALHEPLFAGNEWDYVKDCLDTGWVSSVGSYVDKFEKELAEFTGVKKAIVVMNGTAALHICLKLVGVQAKDEVLIPTLTFVATANAVSYCGAIPHFVDSELITLGIDPGKLDAYLTELVDIREGQAFNRKTGNRIKAVVPMHTFGHPVDLDPLTAVCQKYNLELVEDAAESLGTYYKGKHTGHWGKCSALSFNGNKVITTGGGGAILTNDESLGSFAKHLTTTAKMPHKWEFIHDEVGFNYRMPNINAALGCAQLEQLPSFLERKRILAEQYQKKFTGQQGVSFFTEPSFAKSNYWLNTIMLDKSYLQYRDEILTRANENGIMTRPAWTLLHKLPMFRNYPKMDLSIAEYLEQAIINTPSSVILGGA